MPLLIAVLSTQQHLLVSLQLLDEGAFVEQRLQPLLGVVVAEFLERGSPLLLSRARVLETRCVHNQQGAQGVLARLQSPEGYRWFMSFHTGVSTDGFCYRNS